MKSIFHSQENQCVNNGKFDLRLAVIVDCRAGHSSYAIIVLESAVV